MDKKPHKYYPKHEVANSLYPLEIMLRAHCLQLFNKLSDPTMDGALHEIESMRRFGVFCLSVRLPAESTICESP
ncbi:transposase, partial [Zhongshania sp.]|uniref:transposase n=1 Tax=Zhongshania sp. TaxID=1971902 RepID=UPI0035615AD5